MSTYRVYNEYYSGYNEQDLSSIDFVEVDNAVLNCVKDDNNLYSPNIKKLLNIVNVKVKDIPTFVKRNIILSPQQVVAINADEQYAEEQIKEAWNNVPKYKGTSELDREIIDVCIPATCIAPASTACIVNENYCDNSQYLTSDICMTPSVFDDKPRDIQIDADSIFTSQPKPDVVDNSDLLNISSDTSTLMQGSCLDLFNDNSEKFEDFKIREPEHTSPAKLEKQRRIEEYHKRHNRKRNR